MQAGRIIISEVAATEKLSCLNIYLISGLGADRTVFRNLKFGDEVNLHYLDWIPPKQKESLRAYALRMAEGIDRSVPFVLIGLSFGGMLATEIASVFQPQLTILASSVPTRQDLPWYFHLAGRTGANKLIPVVKPKTVPRFIASFFGVESKTDHLFFQELLERTDPRFSKWAIDSILKWDRTETPERLIRIHGNKDKVLPIGKSKVDYLIKGGGHFMIFNRADEISKILADVGVQ
jgi:pimeloyl-ACP methyl ester carboxylesterase